MDRVSVEPVFEMVVVADTSLIHYLVLIPQIDLLKQLYARIVIAPAVLAELKHPAAPTPVREWADNPTQVGRSSQSEEQRCSGVSRPR